MPAQQQEAAEQERKRGEPDQRTGRQTTRDRGDVEVAREQRDAIAGRAEEQRLAEAHDAGIAPHQVERHREQREDHDAGGEHRQIILQHQRQDQRGNSTRPSTIGRTLRPAAACPHRCGASPAIRSRHRRRRRWPASPPPSAIRPSSAATSCSASALSIPWDRRDRRCARRSRSSRPWRPPCTSSSCSGACPEPFRRARRGLRRSWRGRARLRRHSRSTEPASLTAASRASGRDRYRSPHCRRRTGNCREVLRRRLAWILASNGSSLVSVLK